MVTFTLKVQVVPCVTEHTVNTCKMQPGLGSVLDLANTCATRGALLPAIQTALDSFDYFFFKFFCRRFGLAAAGDDARPDKQH